MRLSLVIRSTGLAVLVALSVASCTTHRADSTSATAICHRHFPNTTAAFDLHVADVRFVGGPRPTTSVPGPLDAYPDQARLVRCLVPTSPNSAEVEDIVVSDDKSFLRWTQSGANASKEFVPLV